MIQPGWGRGEAVRILRREREDALEIFMRNIKERGGKDLQRRINKYLEKEGETVAILRKERLVRNSRDHEEGDSGELEWTLEKRSDLGREILILEK